MRGPELFGFTCILLLLLRGELIQCCTQNFPCAEGELIKCGTKSGRFGLGEPQKGANGVFEVTNQAAGLCKTSFTMVLILI